MTAIQELKDALDDILKGKGVYIAWDAYLVKEKQQIIDAYDAGLFDGTMDDVNDRMHKQYYNETYGSKGSETPLADSFAPRKGITTRYAADRIDEKLSILAENASFANPILAIHEAKKLQEQDNYNNRQDRNK